MIPGYILLGLAVVGGLYWALNQFTVRQRRITAELSRLEQLTAEVSMNAEALLERVDERTDRLAALLAEVEARAEAALVPEPTRAPAPAPAPAPAAAPTPAEAPAPPAPSQRYQELRGAVWAVVDQGKDAGAIAQELGLPRGEVLLLINLRAKKMTA